MKVNSIKYCVVLLTVVPLLINCEGSNITESNTPQGAVPTASTGSATNVWATTATLNGSANAGGLITYVWFEYGTNSSLSNYTTTQQQTIGPSEGSVDISQSISGLNYSTQYFYRLIASNDAGTDSGEISSFYNSITGNWIIDTRDDFSYGSYSGSLYANLQLTQTTNLLYPGVSDDVYMVTGSFSGMSLALNDGEILYAVFGNASGTIANGGININIYSHNLEFDLGNSNFHFQGVSPTWSDMFGDVSVTINMTTLFGTDDGTITLTGMWDGTRQ